MNFLSMFKTKLATTLLALALCAGNATAMEQKKSVSQQKASPIAKFQEDKGYTETRANLHNHLYTLLTSLPKEMIATIVDYTLTRIYGTYAEKIKASPNPIHCLVVLSPTKIAFSLMSKEETHVSIFDLETKQPQFLLGNNKAITSLAVPQKNTVAAGTSNGTIKIWDTGMDCEKPLCVWEAHDDFVTALAALPCNRLVSGSSDGVIKVWSASDGQLLKQHHSYLKLIITAIVVLPDESIAALHENGSIHLCDPYKNNYEECSVVAGQCIAYVAPAKLAVGSDSYVQGFTQDLQSLGHGDVANTITCIDSNTRNKKSSLHGHQSTVKCLAPITNTGFFISGSSDQTLKAWDAKNNQCIATIEHTNKAIVHSKKLDDGTVIELINYPTCLVVLPGGKKAIVGDSYGWLSVFELSFEK